MEADVASHSSDSVATRELNDAEEEEREFTPEIGMENLEKQENDNEESNDNEDCINITFGSKIEELQNNFNSTSSAAPAVKVNTSAPTASKPVPIPKVIKTIQDPSVDGTNIYDYNVDALDKPWLKPGADISDYFNYGFTEDTWKAYCERQRILRGALGQSGHSIGTLAQLLPMTQGGKNNSEMVESISRSIPGAPQIVDNLQKHRHCTLSSDHLRDSAEKLRLPSEVSRLFTLLSMGSVGMQSGVKVNAGSFSSPHNYVDSKALQWDLKEICRKRSYSKTLYKEIEKKLVEVCKDSQFVIVDDPKRPGDVEKSKSHRSSKKSDVDTDQYRRKRSRDHSRSSSEYEKRTYRSRRDSPRDKLSSKKRSKTPERSREERSRRRRRRRSSSSRY